ncbi:MAG TPA: N-acetylglutaminylglutamine amidotransferase [Gammaproteobacteria bacterium]
MCGISGEYRFHGLAASPSTIEAINEQQQRRGPDSTGVYFQDNVALGHRRLMIMDLSPASSQPLHDPQLGLTLVFNGAIYNYREIREELKQQGYRFFSDGDTEVIMKAFHAWGEECLQRFNGMFALAVWCRDENRLFLARDRLGIKPLYFTLNDRFFRFASYLPALLKSPEVGHELEPAALNFYFNFHAVVPAPYTLFKSVKKLKPGHFLWVNGDGTIREQQWWRLDYPDKPESYSPEEWQSQLLDKLQEAVRLRNVAAVDVGILLSGGVDSSLLTGLLAGQKSAPVKTFSVGFESINDEDGDEFVYSDIIAKHFSTEHTKIRVPEKELLADLPNAIAAMAEPMVSHDCIGFYLLAQTVAKHCRAVQSGQGADEVFGGYHWYPPLLNVADPLQAYRERFFDRDHAEYLETLQPQWHTHDYAGEFIADMFSQPGANHPVDKALRLDTTVMLVEDPVKRVDNMTMAASLEARVPFLDHTVVEFAARIPAELKVKDEGKWILKEASRRVIPADVIDRPKGYFPVPALKYLRGNVLEMVQDALGNRRSRERGLFNKTYVNRLIAEPSDHITPLGSSKLWQLALLELWLQSHGL